MELAALIAFLTTMLLTPLAARAAWRAGAVSHPDGARRLQAKSTPLWGGGAVFAGLCLGVSTSSGLGLLSAEALQSTAALMLSAGLICLLGCYDDLRVLSARAKLGGQIIAVLPVVLAGGYVERLGLFGYEFELGWLGGPLTVAWLVLGINALNLLDGIDGLASLTGILVSLAIAVSAASVGSTTLMVPALLLPAALAGFLLHNRPPAGIYLGDAGSMLIGLMIAAMAARTPSGLHAAMNVPVAVLLLLLPLTDTALAILRRSLRGRSLMEADRGHIHHQLLARGFSVWKTLRVLGGFSLLNGCLAWFAAVQGQELLAWTLVIACLPLLIYARLLGHEEWRLVWNKVAGGVMTSQDEAAVPPVAVAPQTLGATVPDPHFHRELQPSGRGWAAGFEASETRRSQRSQSELARRSRAARRPR